MVQLYVEMKNVERVEELKSSKIEKGQGGKVEK